jgi:hypothetical protein
MAKEEQMLQVSVDHGWKAWAVFWVCVTLMVGGCQVKKYLEFKAATEAGLEQQTPSGLNNDTIWVKPR